jgi:hypothetical protein
MQAHTDSAALAQAARMAGFAPSIHNTQPWLWRVDGPSLYLRAERSRQLALTDPSGRMLTVSCGTALHHVRVALAAEGWAAQVSRLPDENDPDLLAHITLTGRIPVTHEAMRALQTVRLRHTDRRPVSDTPVDPDALEALRLVAATEGVHLHLLRREDVIDLASAAARAQEVEAMDASWQEEMSYWVNCDPGQGLGIPDSAIPASAPQTSVPGRDFGHEGILPIGPGHDQMATYAILYGDDDEPLDWLRGGEALSAVWLAAMERDVTVLPLSAAVEVPGTRHTLQRLLAGIGEPFIALRFGVGDPDHAGPPHTPRLPADQVVEIVG